MKMLKNQSGFVDVCIDERNTGKTTIIENVDWIINASGGWLKPHKERQLVRHFDMSDKRKYCIQANVVLGSTLSYKIYCLSSLQVLRIFDMSHKYDYTKQNSKHQIYLYLTEAENAVLDKVLASIKECVSEEEYLLTKMKLYIDFYAGHMEKEPLDWSSLTLRDYANPRKKACSFFKKRDLTEAENIIEEITNSAGVTMGVIPVGESVTPSVLDGCSILRFQRHAKQVDDYVRGNKGAELAVKSVKEEIIVTSREYLLKETNNSSCLEEKLTLFLKARENSLKRSEQELTGDHHTESPSLKRQCCLRIS